MRRLVLLNPKSNHGRAARKYYQMHPHLVQEFGNFELYETKAALDATRRVREALRSGNYDQILVAGGDGSINEALNGYFENGKIISQKIPLGILNLGTGGDFYRTVKKINPRYSRALYENQFRLVDCGRVLASGRPERYFINVTSAGMAGHVLKSLKSSTFQRGAVAYFFHTLKGLAGYTPTPSQIELTGSDGRTQTIERSILNFFVCNAGYSGGGMHWAPAASLEDGNLNLVVISNVSKLGLVLESYKIYMGKIANVTGVEEFQASKVTIRPRAELTYEMDGEMVESSEPIREIQYSVLPGAFPLVI